MLEMVADLGNQHCDGHVVRQELQRVRAMYELDNKIARLQIRAEQLVIHLRSMKRNTTEAQDVRHALLAMLERLRHYKEQRTGASAGRPEA
jgi:hypothetical protein